MNPLPFKLNTPDQWPAPGVYAGVPYTQYATLPACSATMLKALATMTPEKALHYVQNRKVTEAIADGVTLHTFMLEPARFKKECLLAKPCCATLASGKRAGEVCGNESALWYGTPTGWRCGTHSKDYSDGVAGINQNLMDRLLKAHAEVFRVAGDILRSAYAGKSYIELTLIWIDPATEVLCKCRLDLYDPADQFIHDVKKTRSADPEIFGGDVGTFGYHVQDAWYRRGARACFGGLPSFRFIAVELNKNEANGARVLELDGEAKRVGEKVAQDALEVYCKATFEKHWWGYPVKVGVVSLRPWVIRREDALANGGAM